MTTIGCCRAARFLVHRFQSIARREFEGLWYAAGEGNAPGLYFAESKDKGRSFSPRQLLSQETVRGTPALTAGKNTRSRSGRASEAAETKMR